MKMYALLDKKAGTYGGILLAANPGHVSRTIQERFAGSDDTVAKYPEDFDLYELGEYHMENGRIDSDVQFVVNVAVLLPGGNNA